MLEMALKKVYFLVYPSLKVQIFMFVFLFEPNIIAQAQFFHCSRGNGADETVKFGRKACPPTLAMKKLGVLLLVSSIECLVTCLLGITLEMAL